MSSPRLNDERSHCGDWPHGRPAPNLTSGYIWADLLRTPGEGPDRDGYWRRPRHSSRRGTVIRSVSMPPRLPVPASTLIGRVLRLAPGQCRYIDYPLRLRVTRVRVDISLWYDGDWIWLEGDALDVSGRFIARIQALIAVAALA